MAHPNMGIYCGGRGEGIKTGMTLYGHIWWQNGRRNKKPCMT